LKLYYFEKVRRKWADPERGIRVGTGGAPLGGVFLKGSTKKKIVCGQFFWAISEGYRLFGVFWWR